MVDAIKKGAEAIKDKISGNWPTFYNSSSTTCLFLEVTSGVSFEANKAVAKDSNQSVGDRVSSGKFWGWSRLN